MAIKYKAGMLEWATYGEGSPKATQDEQVIRELVRHAEMSISPLVGEEAAPADKYEVKAMKLAAKILRDLS